MVRLGSHQQRAARDSCCVSGRPCAGGRWIRSTSITFSPCFRSSARERCARWSLRRSGRGSQLLHPVCSRQYGVTRYCVTSRAGFASVPMVFAALSLLAGAALVWLSAWLKLRSQQCRQWPSVMGRVTESRVDDARLETTKPILRYHYDVGGQTYVGFRASFSGYGVSRAAMESVIKPYPQGSRVRVYYNPRHPASAVLDNTAPSDWPYWLSFGVGFLVLAVYLVLR
ncbi:hypothetical protein C7B81_12620 [Aphanothece cf. minutissima CCALA 015]|uniref:DUF3592 domain-containing protein n=2 Tax=Aphanothece TaxID=1121 RepID=A0ABX5F5M2_9CHRO|nr:hypothetical protein C7B81_12620 [Aphanothece cf. minutissima CCALA 015]